MQSTSPTRLGLFLQTVVARAYPRIIAQHRRERSWIFFEVLLPMLAVSAYVFVYRAIGAPESYVGFVVVGGAMIAFWANILWQMSSQLFWEQRTATSLYVMAPITMAILLAWPSGMSATLCAIDRAVGGCSSTQKFILAWVWLLFLTFTLTMVALYGMGMMFSSLFLLLNREAWHLSNLAQEPVYLFSGFYFPVKSLDFWIALGASIIPLTLGLDALRQLVFADGAAIGFLSVPIELAGLAVLSVVFVVGSRRMLAYMEKLAIREGRLTESRR
jgi:ABC-2 type transport system permease protein